jgi:hypothetical protein
MCGLEIDIGHVWNTRTQNKGMEKKCRNGIERKVENYTI